MRPHYTGNFSAVDCTEYKTKKTIKNEYSEWQKLCDEDAFYLTYRGVKYYECEYSPMHTENMELLSDISDIEYFDNETEF